MRASEYRGVFETAAEKGAIWVAALSRCGRRSSTERQPIQWAQATCCLGLARIGDTPTALQRCLTQTYSPAASNYTQLIPAPLQHWRGHLNAGIGQLQARTFGADGKRRSTLDRQHGLRSPVEQPGLDPNDDRAWIGQCERLGGDNDSARPHMDRLETRRVGAGKSRWHVLELDTRPGRIGIGVDDPHEVGAVRPIKLTGDLDRYRLARARREPVDITDQWNHVSNLSPLFLRIQHLCDNPDAASAEVVETEAERSALRPYPTGGRRREVGGDDHDRSIGKGLDKPQPCRACHFCVDAKAAVELGFGALQRRVHDIAAQDHGWLRRPHRDANMAGCVARPWLDPHVVVEDVVGGDQLGLATLHDRQKAVFIIGVGGVGGPPFGHPPVLPFLTGEQIAGFWEGRHPSAAACSNRRDRRADACTAHNRCLRAQSRPPPDWRDTASSSYYNAACAGAPCHCPNRCPPG